MYQGISNIFGYPINLKHLFSSFPTLVYVPAVAGVRYNLSGIITAVVLHLVLILTILIFVLILIVLALVLILIILLLIVLHVLFSFANILPLSRLCKNSMLK